MGKRIGVFGGSFNPIHHGHLVLAQDVMEICELDEVRFVPCGIPVHKAEPELAAAVHRVEMVQLSIRSDHRFTVSDYEVSRDTASYTVDTLEAMLVESPGCELTFLLGTDSLPELHNWHRINDLLSLVAVVSVVRPGFEAREVVFTIKFCRCPLYAGIIQNATHARVRTRSTGNAHAP